MPGHCHDWLLYFWDCGGRMGWHSTCSHAAWASSRYRREHFYLAKCRQQGGKKEPGCVSWCFHATFAILCKLEGIECQPKCSVTHHFFDGIMLCDFATSFSHIGEVHLCLPVVAFDMQLHVRIAKPADMTLNFMLIYCRIHSGTKHLPVSPVSPRDTR